MQLKPSVQPPLIGPVGLLLIQPGFHTDALYPSEVLQDGKVGPPDGVVGELDEAGAGEIVTLGAIFNSPLGDAAVEGAGSAMRSRRTLAALAATTVTGLVQQQLAAISTIQAARCG
jgi:hypothetical protein